MLYGKTTFNTLPDLSLKRIVAFHLFQASFDKILFSLIGIHWGQENVMFEQLGDWLSVMSGPLSLYTLCFILTWILAFDFGKKDVISPVHIYLFIWFLKNFY